MIKITISKIKYFISTHHVNLKYLYLFDHFESTLQLDLNIQSILNTINYMNLCFMCVKITIHNTYTL